MEWIAALEGQVVGLDTAPVIYFIEEHPNFLEATQAFFEAMDRGRFRAVTSVVTLLEVLVHPLRHGKTEIVQQYRDILFNVEGLFTVPLTSEIAKEAAQLRARYKIRTPDAIHLATAAHKGASFFLTNDSRLPSLPTLKVLVLDQLRSSQ